MGPLVRYRRGCYENYDREDNGGGDDSIDNGDNDDELEQGGGVHTLQVHR